MCLMLGNSIIFSLVKYNIKDLFTVVHLQYAGPNLCCKAALIIICLFKN